MFLPAGWNVADLGTQEFNAEDPYFFLPLAAAVSGDGAGAFTVGARPSYPDGTFREWLEHLCGRDSIEISNLREFYGDGLRGYLFDGRQPAEGAGMIMRNLYAVCAMSMEPCFAVIARSMSLMTESFRVPNASGPTVDLSPAREPPKFESVAIGVTLPVPGRWKAIEEDGVAVITQRIDQGVFLRIDRRPFEATLLDGLHAAYKDATAATACKF